MPLEPPDWIDARAQLEFEKLALQMESTLRPTDAYVLADFCQTLSDIITLMGVVKKEGPTVLTDSGTSKMNPTMALLLSRRTAFAQLCRALGITPAARREKGAGRPPIRSLKDQIQEPDML